MSSMNRTKGPPTCAERQAQRPAHAGAALKREEPLFGRVGGQRGASAGLLPHGMIPTSNGPFPTAPPRTGLARFRGIRLSSGRGPSACRRSALRVPSRLLPHPLHLTPFALWTAFPSADYYEVSVALGV